MLTREDADVSQIRLHTWVFSTSIVLGEGDEEGNRMRERKRKREGKRQREGGVREEET